MARSRSHARNFWRASQKRFDEALFLLEARYFTAAVYLGGYAVECALKALILWNEPAQRHAATMSLFRGTKAHEFNWLAYQLMLRHVIRPDNANRALRAVAWWTTDLRYTAADISPKAAGEFFQAARILLAWIKGRLP